MILAIQKRWGEVTSPQQSFRHLFDDPHRLNADGADTLEQINDLIFVIREGGFRDFMGAN